MDPDDVLLQYAAIKEQQHTLAERFNVPVTEAKAEAAFNLLDIASEQCRRTGLSEPGIADIRPVRKPKHAVEVIIRMGEDAHHRSWLYRTTVDSEGWKIEKGRLVRPLVGPDFRQ